MDKQELRLKINEAIAKLTEFSNSLDNKEYLKNNEMFSMLDRIKSNIFSFVLSDLGVKDRYGNEIRLGSEISFSTNIATYFNVHTGLVKKAIWHPNGTVKLIIETKHCEHTQNPKNCVVTNSKQFWRFFRSDRSKKC